LVCAIDPNLCHEAHATIALRLWRALHDILALDHLDIGSSATR
jgi:hypothetical protein